MKRTILCFSMLTVFFLSLAAAQTRTESDKSPDVKNELLKILQERKQAIAAGDKEKWGAHISESCLWTGENVLSTSEVRDSIIATAKDFQQKFDLEEVDVRQYGDTAVMTYVQKEHLDREGEKTDTTYRYLDTYVRIKGDWQLVAASETFVPPAAKRAKVDPAILDSYVGKYFFSSTSILTVTREGDKLMGQNSDQEELELVPENETTFFDEGGGSDRYIFVKNEKGAVDHLVFRSHGNDVILKRIE